VSTAPGNIVQFPSSVTDALRVTEAALHRVKPGTYTAMYVRHEPVHVFKGCKVKVLFQLMEHLDVILPRWYRVTSYKGRIAAPARSQIVREITDALGTRIRNDRIPVGALKDLILSVEVSTVTTDSMQEPLSELNQYEVVSRIRGKA